MIAVITYTALGQSRKVHCAARDEYEAVLSDVRHLADMGVAHDVHVYECVELAGATS